MKILHILDHSLPLHSGYSFRSRNIFRSQQEVGLDPLVVTSPKHLESWKGEWDAEESIDGVRYHRTECVCGSRIPLFTEWRIVRKLESRIREVVKKERPRILHAHSPLLNAIPAIRVGRDFGIPVVYEIRAFWEDAAVDHGSYTERGPTYRLVRNLETSACRKADAIVTICEGLREDLQERGISPLKITVVPNAVNAEEFARIAPDPELAKKWGMDGAFVIGFLGSFYHYEGLDLLLEAAARLIARGQNLRTLLVGGGPMANALKDQAARLGIAERVVFPGRVPHDRVPDLYALADVLVFPRKLMRLTDTVTPLKPLEAMAMEKAVVASDVGGHRELIRDGETGLLFPAGDVEDLASSIARLAADTTLRRALGENGNRWVRRERTWARNAGTCKNLYEGLLN